MIKKISVQVALVILATITAIQIAFGIYIILNEWNQQKEGLAAKQEQIIKRLTSTISVPMWNFDSQSSEAILVNEVGDEDIGCILVHEHDERYFIGIIEDARGKIVPYLKLEHEGYIESNYKHKKQAPIFYDNSNIGYVTVFMTEARIIKRIGEIIRVNVLQLIIVLLISIIFLYQAIHRIIVTPINTIIKDVQIIGSGNLTHRITIGATNELSILEEHINEMTESLVQSFEHEKERQSLLVEMEIAETIQTSLLPSSETKYKDFEISAVMRPAEEVGGDFYDITQDKKGKLWLGIGDVSGHGVTPGLVMMMTQTVFNTFQQSIIKENLTPRDVYLTINDVLYDNIRNRLRQNHHMTLNILKHEGDGLFQYSGAHLDIVIHRIKTGSFEKIHTRGIWINLKKNIGKHTHNDSFSLNSGDTMFLFTDGMIEVNSISAEKNHTIELLNTDGLIDLITPHISKDVEAIKNIVLEETLNFCGNKQYDDMSFMVVRKK